MPVRPIVVLFAFLIVATLTLVPASLAGEDGRSRSPWGLVIQKRSATRASSADVGDLLRLVGWSPAAFKGVKYQLCQKRPTGLVCLPGPMPKQDLGYVLKGGRQTFGTWRVTSLSGVGGVLKISLRVQSRLRASTACPSPDQGRSVNEDRATEEVDADFSLVPLQEGRSAGVLQPARLEARTPARPRHGIAVRLDVGGRDSCGTTAPSPGPRESRSWPSCLTTPSLS